MKRFAVLAEFLTMRSWMSSRLGGLLLAAAVLVSPFSSARAADADAEGFESIFDGKTLDKWDGNPDFWSVQDGAITGRTTQEKPTNGNTFLIWRGGETADFELKLEYKIVGGNSGIQYRSFEVPNAKWVVGGYQADFEAGPTYSGINYGERFRGVLAGRGKSTELVRKDGKFEVKELATIGDSNELQSKIKKEDWNEYHVIAQGFEFTHKINGNVTSKCLDSDTDPKDGRRAKGILALQLHAGPPMTVQFRNIRIKQVKAAAPATGAAGAKKKALLLAGNPSHGFGAHDHLSGCSLLAKLLNASGLSVEATVHSLKNQGWPTQEQLDAANTIVIYSDGGGGHPFNAHLEQLNALAKKGTGVVCIHYGVEVPKGAPGDAFLDWTGGYFETNWSVNPHWVANYKTLPKHATTRGVKPFATNDEWYYHMRFREKMDGVTPILTDLPPEQSLSRGDGPHSGNPDVRKAVLERKEPQHMAWARERADGGRGFGTSGGHVHWNWGNNQFRKLVLNAIAWTAGVEIPAEGVPAGNVTVEDLLQDHDEPIPQNFNPAMVQAMLDQWNGKKE